MASDVITLQIAGASVRPFAVFVSARITLPEFALADRLRALNLGADSVDDAYPRLSCGPLWRCQNGLRYVFVGFVDQPAALQGEISRFVAGDEFVGDWNDERARQIKGPTGSEVRLIERCVDHQIVGWNHRDQVASDTTTPYFRLSQSTVNAAETDAVFAIADYGPNRHRLRSYAIALKNVNNDSRAGDTRLGSVFFEDFRPTDTNDHR